MATQLVQERLEQRMHAVPAREVWAASPEPLKDELDFIDTFYNRSKRTSKDAKKDKKKKKHRDKDKHKKSKKHKKKHKRKKSSRRSRSRSSSSDSDSDSDSFSDSDSDSNSDSRRRRHKKRKSREQLNSTSASTMEASQRPSMDNELFAESKMQEAELAQHFEQLKKQKRREEEAAAAAYDDVVGPVPLPAVELKGHSGHMLPGEADAMADFVQQDKRIPRRGEIGLTADEIVKYEDLGYVMSGSRHRRMNAVRIRKESQVYSAEEKRMLEQVNQQEKVARENKIIADLREMAEEKLKQQKRNK
jgi:hypothetical protein